MTLDDLITELTALQDKGLGEAIVLVDGYESGCQDIRCIQSKIMADLRDPDLEWENWWAGYYEDVEECNDGEPHTYRRAVVISR